MVGCAEPAAPRSGLTIALESDPQSLDPRFGADASSARIADLLHVGLTRSDPPVGRRPEAATAWRWLDPQTLEMGLRDDLRFADGSPLTSLDVRATYDAVRDPAIGSPRRATIAALERVEAPNAHTIVFRLARPDAAFLDATGLPILPARLAASPDDVTIGAGPFRLVRARRGDRIELAPNIHWPGGAPALDPLVLRIVPDATVRVLELERGGVGLLQESLEPEILGRLRARPGIRVSVTPGTSVAYLAFNFRDRRLADRRVRRAIASALDRPGLAAWLLGETGRAATGLLAPEHWAYAVAVPPTFSPRRARRLLDRAGFPDPDGDGPLPRFRVVYKTSNQPARRRLAEALQANLADVGIALDVRSYEWGTLFADVRAGAFELVALTWVGVADPDLYQLAYHSDAVPPAGFNRGRYASRAMDRLTDGGRRTTDLVVRRRLYARVQRWAAHDLPALPLWWEDRVAASTVHLRDFAPTPSGDLAPLAGARLE